MPQGWTTLLNEDFCLENCQVPGSAFGTTLEEATRRVTFCQKA